jgi:hypothetical protein
MSSLPISVNWSQSVYFAQYLYLSFRLKNKILEIQLKTSLKNLIELKKRMLLLDKNRRPNCEEILNEKENGA